MKGRRCVTSEREEELEFRLEVTARGWLEVRPRLKKEVSRIPHLFVDQALLRLAPVMVMESVHWRDIVRNPLLPRSDRTKCGSVQSKTMR